MRKERTGKEKMIYHGKHGRHGKKKERRVYHEKREKHEQEKYYTMNGELQFQLIADS
jgi:hypothetical protein